MLIEVQDALRSLSGLPITNTDLPTIVSLQSASCCAVRGWKSGSDIFARCAGSSSMGEIATIAAGARTRSCWRAAINGSGAFGGISR
jgi:hypothetical protein